MQRYFVPKNRLNGTIIEIDGNDHHHIANVLRMNEGEQILCVIEEDVRVGTIT